ncbi:HNH endonuclease signature motif containing protein [Trujillonella endophytica]|uniref:HNH endonuclease n=1 Tax=Trujillonella endophytica TaxID=673521 RepID=A0A1H8WFN4_9ACTN|nr:HNH endonuclease signature motif containing protein [Trujillella endophytica]SEP25928.1 HNH endonuclease [Trujillella endophytica]
MAPTELPMDELAKRITSAAVRLAAATAAWLALIAEFDRREGWGGYGIRSCAQWLAWQCGLSTGTAREHVRVARALAELPATATAFAAGRLTYSKVRALTRVADPVTEPVLLELAHELTAAQLESVVHEWRRDEKPNPREVAAKQRFDHHWDEAGNLHLRICLDAETGAAFLAGVESLVERDARRERAAEKRAATEGADGAAATVAPPDDADAGPPTEQEKLRVARRREIDEVAAARDRSTARRCATLGRLASAAADADRRAGDPPRREVVVHVDAAVLADDTAAYIEGGPALHPATVRRMLCEATVLTMLSNGHHPLALGHAHRFATRAQRRALYRRDRGCARPGCTETRPERLHAHHIRHWLFGGPTDITNMVLLCDIDHALVHDEDLLLHLRHDGLIALTPDGRRIWGRPDAAFTTGLAGLPDYTDTDTFVGVHPIDQARGRRPSASAGTPPAAQANDQHPPAPTDIGRLLALDPIDRLPDALHVNGERMDLEFVVWALLGQRDLARRLAAENDTGNTDTDLGAAAA